MARLGQKIELTMEEEKDLLTMSRSHKLEKRYAERAMIILYSARGKSLDEIIELTGKSRPVVNKWRKRFQRDRLEGLFRCPKERQAKDYNSRTKGTGYRKSLHQIQNARRIRHFKMDKKLNLG